MAQLCLRGRPHPSTLTAWTTSPASGQVFVRLFAGLSGCFLSIYSPDLVVLSFNFQLR
jgi:hypothetical protein